jgi:hypothetical protein
MQGIKTPNFFIYIYPESLSAIFIAIEASAKDCAKESPAVGLDDGRIVVVLLGRKVVVTVGTSVVPRVVVVKLTIIISGARVVVVEFTSGARVE